MNTFMIGAPKAGTSTIWHRLRAHPGAFVAVEKEPDFFCDDFVEAGGPRDIRERARACPDDAIDAWLRGPLTRGLGCPLRRAAQYLALFRDRGAARIVAEGSTTYLRSTTAAANIARVVPGARLIVALRDPADRAWSQHHYNVATLNEPATFRGALRRDLACTDRRIGATPNLFEAGLYAANLARVYAHFPRAQVHLMFFDDLRRDPEGVLAAMLRFLELDPAQARATPQRVNPTRYARWPALERWTRPLRRGLMRHRPAWIGRAGRALLYRSRAPRMPRAVRAELRALYRDDTRALQDLVGRDLSGWLA